MTELLRAISLAIRQIHFGLPTNLDVCAFEDDEVVDAIAGRDLRAVFLTTFSAERTNCGKRQQRDARTVDKLNSARIISSTNPTK